ncbi:MAG TPA: hypothetical protein VME20_09760 [Acidimicrobiales bacterium]|nr:hypothetical protein [Acidimicrobiales bacterium]
MAGAQTARHGGFGSWRHLGSRFFGALSPAGPCAEDEDWALRSLLEGERSLWHRMSGPDRRHAVGVAKEALELLCEQGPGTAEGAEAPADVPREVVAAALLHDVGKLESSLGTFSRVAVTLATMAAGRERLLNWSEGAQARHASSWRARAGLYLVHDSLGARLLEDAGSDPFTVSWAREHHLSPGRWTVDKDAGAALKAADGD